MQFNSINFMIFFPIVLGIYFVIPRKLREFWLLFASYWFYMSWNPRYAVLIAASTLITYVSGLFVQRSTKSSHKKAILAVCLVSNLAILIFFKYTNFLLLSAETLLSRCGLMVSVPRFDIVLPVGISFYTFQALGYIIDVYRGETEAEKNPIKYALFVSFFPQLVAGPIERSKNLLSQIRGIEKIRLWNVKRVASGAILMVWGYFLKMVIADRVAVLCDTVFDSYLLYGSTELIAGAIGFAIQIYCDFGSYSMIAIGAARILGFSLMENFNTPYFAVSIHDFWSRWHISLSTWFRDYLYIPLGGNRKGAFRKELNKLIVFLLSGLWHGANWTFVVWGAIHGVYQVIEDCLGKHCAKLLQKCSVKVKSFGFRFLRVLLTFLAVDFAWIFFRSDSIREALGFIRRIFTHPTPWNLTNGTLFTLGLDRVQMNILFFSLLLLLFVDLIRYRRAKMLDQWLMEQSMLFTVPVMVFLVLFIFIFGMYGPAFDPQQFIYFQF